MDKVHHTEHIVIHNQLKQGLAHLDSVEESTKLAGLRELQGCLCSDIPSIKTHGYDKLIFHEILKVLERCDDVEVIKEAFSVLRNKNFKNSGYCDQLIKASLSVVMKSNNDAIISLFLSNLRDILKEADLVIAKHAQLIIQLSETCSTRNSCAIMVDILRILDDKLPSSRKLYM